MGLIKAGLGAAGGVLADQWKEFFYCDSLPTDVLIRRGQKQVGGRSSNTKGHDNIISNGSGIAVADGQCMIIVEQGKVVEVCAEPGEFTYDTSTEPSIFSGNLGEAIKETFKAVGKRFAYGGDTGKDQRVYYFNTKLILDNKFGTPAPIMFEVINAAGQRRTVNVRCNGTYVYRMTDPLKFYTNIASNVTEEYTRDGIDGQLKADFVDALQPALAVLSADMIRPAQIPAHAKELRDAMMEELKAYWVDTAGISIEKITMNPITLNPEDMQKLNELEDTISVGSSGAAMAGTMAAAMRDAANNQGGAMNGFIGMGMAGNMMGNMGAQNFFQMGQQQQAAPAAAPAAPAANGWKCACGATATGKFCPECGAKKPEPPAANGWKCACGATATGKFCPECGAPKPAEAEGWTCACGAVNKGKFCMECGAKKPAGAPLYRCDKCGWEPADPHNPPKFCMECGDPFDENDVQ